VNTLDQLASLTNERERVETKIRDAVYKGRAEGLTWEEVGAALGRSRQAVMQRYARNAPPSPLCPGRGTGRGYPTAASIETRDTPIRCDGCGETKPGRQFPVRRRPSVDGAVRHTTCKDCQRGG
jgi:hypothetical protein